MRRFSRLGINFLGGGSEIKFLWHYIHLGLCPSLYPILHYHPVPSFRHSKYKNMAWCVFTISRQGWDLGNCTQRFHDVQGWHPKRNRLPSRKTKGYLSPQWTLISKSVSFEQVPGADADLRDKQAVQATDVRLGNWTDNSNSISHPCARPAGFSHGLGACLRVVPAISFLMCHNLPFVVPEHSGA